MAAHGDQAGGDVEGTAGDGEVHEAGRDGEERRKHVLPGLDEGQCSKEAQGLPPGETLEIADGDHPAEAVLLAVEDGEACRARNGAEAE